MKRYKFRLEQVLKVRKTQEELAKAELATANRAVTAAEAVLEARAAHYASVPRMTHQQPTAAFLGERFRHDAAAAAVMAARASRAAANACAAERRMVWSERAREVQILVRLDDRRRVEHELEAARQADLEVDDIVVGRHGRSEP
jgi:flagellar export protein FliJ